MVRQLVGQNLISSTLLLNIEKTWNLNRLMIFAFLEMYAIKVSSFRLREDNRKLISLCLYKTDELSD